MKTKPKFKKGDRVFFRTVYSDTTYEDFGILIEDLDRGNGVTVKADSATWYDNIRKRNDSLFYVELDRDDELMEFENIYKSSLYEAMK